MATDAEKGRYTSPEGSKIWEYLAIFVCSTLGLCIGCAVGWNSPSVVKLMESDSPIRVTASDVSTLVAALAIGNMVAPPVNTLIVDRIGRKNTLLVCGMPLIVSWSLITIANNVWILYVARFMAGLSLGLSICVTPMYVGEVSSVDTRGAGGALMGVMFNLGILVPFIIAPYLSIPTTAGIFLALSIGFVFAFWFMPESPYFLALKGRTEDAEGTLEKLRGKPNVSEELEAITTSLSHQEKDNDSKGGLKALFTVRANRRAFFIIALFSVTHHFGGFFMVLTYGQLMFKTTRSMISDHMANIVIGVMQVISSIITGFLVDRFGRKPLIFISGFLAGICNLVIAIFFYAKDYMDADMTAFSLAPFIASMVLVFAFNCGLMSMQMIMMSEVFATDVKAISTCLVSIVSGLLATVSAKLYILIVITWNYGHCPCFVGFFVIVWLCAGLIMYLTPETKGKTFVEIQRELSK